ncbi:MAG TPA: hypothetical protein V6D25_28345 [Leptolyngbyaceae cyanobacterium]
MANQQPPNTSLSPWCDVMPQNMSEAIAQEDGMKRELLDSYQ